MERIKCLVIGGGPAGYTAAIYACRAALDPTLVEGPEPGGQLITTTKIENYPGFAEGIDAQQLMMDMRAQALNLGTTFISGSAQSCDFENRSITLSDGSQLFFETLIIATGASAKYLGLESESKFRGMGVSACATCDGFFYRDRTVAVVGGGDSACEEALYLSGLARENGEIFEIKIDGFFLAIGRHPNTEWLGGGLALTQDGYIKSEGVKTEVEGVFVAGDVRNTDFRQAITAAADGCRAALEAEKYIKNKF